MSNCMSKIAQVVNDDDSDDDDDDDDDKNPPCDWDDVRIIYIPPTSYKTQMIRNAFDTEHKKQKKIYIY